MITIPRLSTKTAIGTDAEGRPVYASLTFVTMWNLLAPQLEKLLNA